MGSVFIRNTNTAAKNLKYKIVSQWKAGGMHYTDLLDTWSFKLHVLRRYKVKIIEKFVIFLTYIQKINGLNELHFCRRLTKN